MSSQAWRGAGRGCRFPPPALARSCTPRDGSESGLSPESPGLWVTCFGDSASPVDGAAGVTAVPTVTEVSLLSPLSVQAGQSRWGTLPGRCHHGVSQSTQKSPNSLGSSKAKPAPGARAASASAKGPGEGPVPLLPGWSSVLVVSPCPGGVLVPSPVPGTAGGAGAHPGCSLQPVDVRQSKSSTRSINK